MQAQVYNDTPAAAKLITTVSLGDEIQVHITSHHITSCGYYIQAAKWVIWAYGLDFHQRVFGTQLFLF